ncbi:hypothetical protein LSTR_LSTR000435 [Laodelphax striatellus]|uniref:Uncharacterized protein n=1 Tax=Laodelphax striatellus TaxID=195883 RepID=A0A482X4M5_LAOST|nr:hypothetical protein LSTR_LSTR000435 [Laodelphax striatellus]
MLTCACRKFKSSSKSRTRMKIMDLTERICNFRTGYSFRRTIFQPKLLFLLCLSSVVPFTRTGNLQHYYARHSTYSCFHIDLFMHDIISRLVT